MSYLLRTVGVVLIAVLLVLSSGAEAALTLTPAGIARGYGLSTFATGFPTSSISGTEYGPFGIAFPSTGGVVVSDAAGNVRLFPNNQDGQIASSAPIGQTYAPFNPWDMATIGTHVYLSRVGQVSEITGTGTFVQTIVSGLTLGRGLVANPANGHLFEADAVDNTVGTAKIYDVDPILKTKTLFKSSLSAVDGLSISQDGSVLYVAEEGVNGRIHGLDTLTGNEVFNSGTITANGVTGGIDGTARGYGARSNYLYANLNSGSVVEINLTTNEQFVIATNGSRGDFMKVDPNNLSLLVTQTNSIVRLTGIPEPTTLTAFGAGWLILLRCSNRKRRIGTGDK